jgi:hypothetical protein
MGPLPTHHPRGVPVELWECPQRVSRFLSFAWRQGHARGLKAFLRTHRAGEHLDII